MVNEPLAYDFFVTGRMAHGNDTFFNILRLLDGHNMIVCLEDLSITLKKYYQLHYSPNLGTYDQAEPTDLQLEYTSDRWRN